MKEEKRISSRISTIKSKKNIQTIIPTKSIISNELENYGSSNQYKKNILNKHFKRIGCKSRLKAYRTTIDQSIYQQVNYSNQSSGFISGTIKQNKQEKRRRKMIGNKKIIDAYKQIIMDLQKIRNQKEDKKNNQNIQNKQNQQNKQNFVFHQKKFEEKRNNQQITILDDDDLDPNQSQIINQSPRNQNKTKQQYIPLIDEVPMRKISSGVAEQQANGDSFSININVVSNTSAEIVQDRKLQTGSILEKSDECLESFNQELDQRFTQSLILNGSFERLMNESSINTSSSLNQDEGQMKELVQEIQKNLQNEDQKQNQLKCSGRINLLEVPTGKNKQKRKFLSKEQKKIDLNILQTKQDELKVKQQQKQTIQKTQQQKLLQMIEQRHKKFNKNGLKRSSKKKKSTIIKRSSKQRKSNLYLNEQVMGQREQGKNKKSKQSKIQDFKKVNQVIQQQKQNQFTKKLIQNRIKSEKKPLPERMFITQTPKSRVKQTQKEQNLIKSNIIFPINKNTTDKVQIDQIKNRANANSVMTSLHNKIKVQGNPQKQITSSKYKKTSKNIEDLTPETTTSHYKRNKNKLEVSKYVNEARKLLTNSVHF